MGNAERPLEEGLVKCDITGKWVRPDEVVEFQGYRVCAQGKEELLARLRSGEAMPGEMERPGVWLRFGCIFLDGILLGAVNFAIGFVIGFTVVSGALTGDGMADDGALPLGMNAIVSLLGIVVGLAYFTILHGTKGQTIGKMAGKLKVINLDGSPISMGKALWRAVAYQGPGIIMPFVMLAVASLGEADETAGLAAIGVVGIIGGIYSFANIVVALVDRDKQRALHDHLAGTRVIKIG